MGNEICFPYPASWKGIKDMFGLDKDKNFCEWEYDVDKEPLLAALFTTGNGYMGVRGSSVPCACRALLSAAISTRS